MQSNYSMDVDIVARTLDVRKRRDEGQSWRACAEHYGVSHTTLRECEKRLAQEERIRAAAESAAALQNPDEVERWVLDRCRDYVRRDGKWAQRCQGAKATCRCLKKIKSAAEKRKAIK